MYRGTEVPALAGTYVYGDYCTGEVRGLAVVDGDVVDDTTVAGRPRRPVAFAQDPSGEVYVLTQPGPDPELTPT